MVRHYALIIIIALIANPGHSQNVPGYQGKRMSILGGISLSPLSDFLFNDHQFDDSQGKIYNLLPKLNLNLNYTISRNKTLGINADFRKEHAQENDTLTGEAIAATHTLMAVVANYRSFLFRKTGSIAPMGSYQNMEIGMVFSSTSANDGPNLGKYSSIILSYGWGRTNVISDRVLIDFGAKFWYSPLGHGIFGQSYSDDDQVKNNASNSIAVNYFVSFYFNIGFLVF